MTEADFWHEKYVKALERRIDLHEELILLRSEYADDVLAFDLEIGKLEQRVRDLEEMVRERGLVIKDLRGRP